MMSSIVSRSFIQSISHSASSKSASLVAATAIQTRAFASVLPQVPGTSKSGKASKPKVPTPEGHLRPHLGVQVDPNHGLYAFFRRVEKDGEVDYETLEAHDPATGKSGRSWTAAELRRKSFKDLHTLWYVLLRERNLLATQHSEAKRVGIVNNSRLSSEEKARKVRKSMARIKYVINERRLAYEGAMKILEARNQVLRGAEETSDAESAQLAEEQAKAGEEASQVEASKKTRSSKATDAALAGLFSQSGEQTSGSKRA